MRISTYLLILLLSLISFTSFAQTQKKKQDVLYLKNGGILRGQVLKTDSDSTITIEILGKNIFVYDLSEVKVVTREDAVPFVKERKERVLRSIKFKKQRVL